MTGWVMRALLLGALVVGMRTLLGFAMVYWPTQGSWLRLLCLAALIGAVAAWGILDGRKDREVHPDPEHGSDLTIMWLKAAVAGGVGMGVVSWLLDFLPRFDLGDNPLLFEATVAAAFIVLLIFLPALAGVGIGRMLAERRIEKKPPAGVSGSAA
ncbi:B-4DMT family transporter [Nocardia sp. NPDC127579]|uniref:B-4DMT family transporter n=1 Tax=Nocardia sp. NPDC127579 TaxID=3345402 RepID=UPI00363C7800